MSYEEKKRLLYEKLAQGFPRDKPAVDVLTAPVSPAFAEKAKANTAGVRLVVCGADGVTTIERPKANPNRVTVLVNSVQDVDAYGRPIWPKAGAEHEYNPLDRL
jgi:hypothetical protein